MRKLVKLIFCLLLSNLLNAQLTGLELLGDQEKIDIPFEINQGFIILNVTFEGFLPLRFILDTGAEHTLLFKKEFADVMGCTYGKRIKVVGADLGTELYALISRQVRIKLPKTKTVKADILVLERNAYNIEKLIGSQIDGLLGISFFNKLVLKINYKKNKLTLYNPNFFETPDDDYEVLKLDIVSHKPYIDGIVTTDNDSTSRLKFLLDSGAALPFLLHQNTHPDLKLPSKYINGNLGLGLGGELKGYIGKTKNLKVGPFNFQNLLTSYQDLDPELFDQKEVYRNGIIGNQWMQRFHIIYNSFTEKLYLKPIKRKFNREFKYDKSGLNIIAAGSRLNHFIVKSVVKDSPADLAGIRRGDRILSVGMLGYNWISLSTINKKLKKKPGKTIRMKIQRGTEIFKVKFKLKDLF